MDQEIEIIRCEIQCEIYDSKIRALIEKLLQIDEETTKLENELKPTVRDRSAA